MKPDECHPKNLEEVMEWLGGFPSPKFNADYDEGGESITKETWVFRGLKDKNYDLKPTIERENGDRTALETYISAEFGARAHSHLKASVPKDRQTRLALMQHYGIPTRLLDFTYSPFVALYFSIEEEKPELDLKRLAPSEREQLFALLEKAGTKRPREYVRIWAIDADAVNDRFIMVTSAAEEAEAKAERKQMPKNPGFPRNILDLSDLISSAIDQREVIANEEVNIRPSRIAKALSNSHPSYQKHLRQHGCVVATIPPSFNQRLVSQQGLFLVNCAKNLNFQESLFKMMDGISGWAKRCDIPVDLIPKIEERLFQMNIHHQSLFPDLTGLAGLIRQKIRLHWK
jgi:hypothetical protein